MAQINLPENSKVKKGKYFKDQTGSKNLRKVNIYRWDPSSGENPRDHTLFSTIAMSFENVRIGKSSLFANGLIFNNTSLVNGPIINLGLSSLNKLDMSSISTTFPVSK